ncbi:MAG: hypothetical protein WD065_03530, partial [Planctomycetaceae bacterium]
PKMGINLSGVGLIRPNFWTAYDPSSRFLRSLYLDAGIVKFVPRRRAHDFIPDTNYKVCEAPQLFFFERDTRRGFADFLGPHHSKIVDWADTFVQAIDILYRLGFRKLLLAGCEMRVRPSREQIQRAAMQGVTYSPFGRLRDFVRDCERAGLTANELDRCPAGPHYHFDETKTVRTAVRTDEHYLRIVQSLRLSRRSIADAGLQIISVTPHSRLNDLFAYRPIRQVLREINLQIGPVAPTTLRCQYQKIDAPAPSRYGPIEDVMPHRWNRNAAPALPLSSSTIEPKTPFDDECEIVVERRRVNVKRQSSQPSDRLVRALRHMDDESVTICEEG